MSSEFCYSCNEKPLVSYKFKIKIDKDNINNNSSKIQKYCHRMCPECLIRYIFIKKITLFEKPLKEYTIFCPCEKGSISLTYEQIIDLFQNKATYNLHQKKEKKCQSHNKIFEKYCKDCKEDVCQECLKEQMIHYNHRIEDKKILYDRLRSFFSGINLKNNTFQKFMENFNKICGKFKEIFEKNYNDILIALDKIINSLIDFRAKYSVYYKEKVINSVQTLKILKMFYSNYYYDIHKAENGTDFKIYKYLNKINYELDDVKVIDDKNINPFEKLNQIKENSDYLNENINEILDISYHFKKLNNGYRKYQSIQRCDDKNLRQIFKINEYKIITSGEGYYMNYLEDINGDFYEESKIYVNDKITSILLLKNKNLLTSFGKNSHFNIQEWVMSENYTNVKSDNSENINLNKSFNESEIKETSLALNKSMSIEPSSLRSNSIQINNNRSLYNSNNSFKSNHEGDINVMVEMSNEMFASGGNDKKIIIWEKDKTSKKYKIFQTIKKEIKEIKNMIFLYDERLVSADSDTIYILYINQNKIENPLGYYSIQQKIISKNGQITSLFQVKEGYLLFGTNNSYIEIYNDTEGKYRLYQNINLKISGINSINQLKDNKIIIASNQGLIKIFELKKNNETDKYEYQQNEYIKIIKGSPINCIECFEDGSFIVGQKTQLHVWKNNESF